MIMMMVMMMMYTPQFEANRCCETSQTTRNMIDNIYGDRDVSMVVCSAASNCIHNLSPVAHETTIRAKW
jgi:hypothetical protein